MAFYSHELGMLICDKIASGMSLREVCREEGMPPKTTVMRWLKAHDEFRKQYEQAREDLLEHWADEILEIADDGTNDWVERENKRTGKVQVLADFDHINRSRLRVDARKWLMSKLAPKKYGDKITQEHVGGDGPAMKLEVNQVKTDALKDPATRALAAQLYDRVQRPDDGQ